MNNNIELLRCKVSLFKMLDQFGWQTEYKGEHCLSTLCESAGEWAFDALKLEDDPITMEKFYTEYDKVWTEWCHANGTEPGFSYLEFYKKDMAEIKPWKLTDDVLDEIEEEDESRWIITENGCVITCPNCGERLELCYPDGTEVRYLPHCPWCGKKLEK
jgi:hypothetical protein